MSRQRWFCQVCGALTQRTPARDGRALCAAHAGLPLIEPVPADPLNDVPTMREDTIRQMFPSTQCQVCEGTGVEHPAVECHHCNGYGRLYAARQGEDALAHGERGQ